MKYYKTGNITNLIVSKKVEFGCNRVNNLDNNRCINCGAKEGHKCEKHLNKQINYEQRH